MRFQKVNLFKTPLQFVHTRYMNLNTDITVKKFVTRGNQGDKKIALQIHN